MEKEFYLFLNSLRCPLCKSLIDGNPSKNTIYYCSYDYQHYQCKISIIPPFQIIHETVILIYNKKMYYIVQSDNKTLITIRSTDLENRVIDSIPPQLISFNMLIFNFIDLDKNRLINKVKNLIVFQ